jgi:hypothetical protein
MIPPNAQLHVEPRVSAGLLPISVRGAPGFHGPTGAGTHGIGVSTPSAVAVAAATVGLARLEHIPKGGMLAPGMMSGMVPAGLPPIITLVTGITTNVEGAMPKLHSSPAVAVTQGLPIGSLCHLPDPLIELCNFSPVVVTRHISSGSLR